MITRKILSVFALIVLTISFAACTEKTNEADTTSVQNETESAQVSYTVEEDPYVRARTLGIPDTNSENVSETERTKEMRLMIGDQEVSVFWEDNESAEALRELVKDGPLTISMSMYGGFEQVGPLGASLPSNDVQTTTSAGDIVLYSGNQVVIFYGSNAWSYTRLGHVELSAAEMSDLLSHEDVTISLFAE